MGLRDEESPYLRKAEPFPDPSYDDIEDEKDNRNNLENLEEKFSPGQKIYDGSRRRVLKNLIDRRGSTEDIGVDDKMDISSVASEPDRGNSGT